ncbi:MAG: hypothetical protein ABSG65_24835 [Bryobacteraceae bacterium]|jgi:hypothetical protein
MRSVWPLLPLCIVPIAAGAPFSVKQIAGNIFLVQDNGHNEQLTASGIDSMPAISADGDKVVFVRSGGAGRPDDLCLIYVKHRHVQKPLSIVAPALAADIEIGSILDPQFSPDSSAVYFLTRAGNFGGIVRVELAPPKSYVVARGAIPIENGGAFDVIVRGKYIGDLIVYKDSEKLTAGRLFLYWLIDPYGGNLAIIADKLNDVNLFRAATGLEGGAN